MAIWNLIVMSKKHLLSMVFPNIDMFLLESLDKEKYGMYYVNLDELLKDDNNEIYKPSKKFENKFNKIAKTFRNKNIQRFYW